MRTQERPLSQPTTKLLPRSPILGPLRVVVIDDNAALLGSMAQLLADYGIQVAATGTDGDQALPLLDAAATTTGGVDALVIDERMPRMTGIQATRLVRGTYPTLPVILHTAYAGLLGDQPRQAGVTVQVSKAAHPLTLVAAVRRACGVQLQPPVPARVLAAPQEGRAASALHRSPANGG